VDPDDGGPLVAIDGGSALGNPAFLQRGSRIAYRWELTPQGPRAREVRWAPGTYMDL